MWLSITCPQIEYDQEMSQSHTVDLPTVPLRSDTEHEQSHDIKLLYH